MYKQILVPVDGSPTSDAGLREAIRLARMGRGRLRLLHVVDDMPGVPISALYGTVPSDLSAEALARGAALLERGSAMAVEAGVDVETVLAEGIGRQLGDFVEDQVKAGADIIVLGTHGRRGISRLLLGSGAEHILRLATVPVLLVRCPDDNLADTPPGARVASIA